MKFAYSGFGVPGLVNMPVITITASERLFALNNTDDSFLEETRELLGRSAVSQKPAKSRIIRTILIAAVLAALMAATAYAIV